MKKLLLISISILIILTPSPVNAATSQGVSVAARPNIGSYPPTGFTVTRITDTQVQVSWTPDPGSANTTIRVKYDAIPESAEDGYLLYCGTGSNVTDTYLNLDVMWSKQYYVAASVSPEGYYSEYIYEYVENPNVEEIADSIDSLSDVFGLISSAIGSIGIHMIFEILLVLGLLFIAIRTGDLFLYIVSGIITMFISISWVQSYPNLSIPMFCLGGYFIFKAIILSFEGGASKGWSQFKSIWGKIREKL